jgi:SAM-dependent methyltransferase
VTDFATTTSGKVDLDWDDSHVVPRKVTPDLVFLFDRMIEATIDKVDPSRGDRVLDVGSGRSVDAIKIARRGGKPVGLEPSRTMLAHSRKCVAESGCYVGLVQGIAENLPFRDSSFDWVVCKGALDHFPDPYKTMEEVARVLKPEGRAVISIANFESLGHRLGRNVHRLTRWIPSSKPKERQAWETPPDHTYRFDYPLVIRVVSSHLAIQSVSGVSLFWGAPLWDRITSTLPKPVSFFIMRILDKVARRIPSMSDVVLVTCTQKSPRP